MSHSNSSLNCFASCMAKYENRYIKRLEPKHISPHLTFGTMAHEVMYKAGVQRDNLRDCVSNNDYETVIPSEVLHSDLKETFSIKNWRNYFLPVIKKAEEYEKSCINELLQMDDGKVQVERELKLQISVEQLRQLGCYDISQPFVAVIDLLMYTATHAIILDYKFSTKQKTQDNFDMDSQLPLYAYMIHLLYDIPLHNIQYGYIDIPKTDFTMPVILSNGTVSRSKSQNVSQEWYKNVVDAIHEGDAYYNCEPGGYYYDCWCNLAHNKAAYLSKQWLDLEVVSNVTNELFNTAKLIDIMIERKLPFVQKYDAYTCQNCEYVDYCKPYLSVNRSNYEKE